ncbi:MAG: DUF2878 domain-containing protein [Legionellaceae bacterium]|nr:DUF2878 domain-containing protein [Legionellaceae bacterium]
MNNTISWLVHFTAYYLSWIGCLYFASLDHPYLSALFIVALLMLQIIWQMRHGFSWKAAFCYGMMLAALGAITDSIWIWLHLIYFKANPFDMYFAPLWIITLWLSFGFNLILLYSAYLNRYMTISVLTLFSIPLAYWLGIRIGAAESTGSASLLYVVLGVSWAILIPLSLSVFNRFRNTLT